jgi:hypothetical protein
MCTSFCFSGNASYYNPGEIKFDAPVTASKQLNLQAAGGNQAISVARQAGFVLTAGDGSGVGANDGNPIPVISAGGNYYPNYVGGGGYIAGFEYDAVGFVGKGSTAVAQSYNAAASYEGYGYMTVSNAAGTAIGDGFKFLGNTKSATSLGITFVANQPYVLSMYVKGSVTAGSLEIGHTENGATELNTGTGINGNSCTALSISSTYYTRLVCSFTAGATISGTNYVYLKSLTNQSLNLSVDAVQLITGSSTLVAYANPTPLQLNAVISSPVVFGNYTNSTNAFQVINASGQNLVNVDTGTNSVTLSTPSNSTTAFQIQNASSASLFTADTSNMNITLNGANNGGLQSGSWTSGGQVNIAAVLQSRRFHTSVTANGYAYIIGGNDGTSATAAQTTVYYAKLNADGSIPATGAQGAWAATTAMTGNARQFHSSVVANGYLYVIGGSDGTTTQSTVLYAKINGDGTLGTWNTTTSINVSGAQPREGHTSVYANGYIYVIGGVNGSGTPQSTTYYAKVNADGTLGSWAATTAINGGSTVAYHSSVVANGYLYVIGGNSTNKVGNGTSTGVLSSVYEAKLNSDGTVGTWTSTTAIPAARQGASAVVMNGYVYVIGGSSDNSGTMTDPGLPQSTVYYAPLNADGTITASSWNTTTPLTLISDYGAAFVANGYIQLTGGYNDGGITSNRVYYASGSRIKVGGALDLVGLSGENLAEGGTGGELTAGNTNIIGALQVQGAANFANAVSVGGTLSVGGDTTIRSATNSTSAFQVQTPAGANLFNVDTSGLVVNVGTVASTATTVNIGSVSSLGGGVNIASGFFGSGITLTSGAVASTGTTISGSQTTGTIAAVTGNNLTTGSALAVSSSSSSLTSGNLGTFTLNPVIASSVTQSGNLLQVNRNNTVGGAVSQDGNVVTVDSLSSASITVTDHGDGKRLLLVQTGCSQTVVDNGTITLTKVSSTLANGLCFYYTTAPPLGTNTITGMSPSFVINIVSSWYNVDQTTPVSASDVNSSVSGGATLNVPSSATDLVVDNGVDFSPGTMSKGAGQSYLSGIGGNITESFSNTLYVSTSKPGQAGTTSMSETGTNTIQQHAIAIHQASGALTVTGAVASISSNCTVANGTCADSGKVLSVTQSYASATGTALYVQNSGTGSAFQIQNGSSNTLFNADTTNMRLGVNVTYAAMTTPTGLAVGAATSGGSLTASAVYKYKVTAIDSAGGETAASTEASGTVGASGTQTLPVTWTAVTGASGYRVYRTAANGAANSEVYLTSVLTNSFTDTGSLTAGTATPPASTNAYVSTNVSNANLALAVGGLGTPTGQLYVSGAIPSARLGSYKTSANQNAVAVQGRYAYTVDSTNNKLNIFDVSNPAAPVLVSSTTSCAGGSCGPISIALSGHYAYIGNDNNFSFDVFDISNPASPTNVSGDVGLFGSPMFGDPNDIYAAGRYVYVVTGGAAPNKLMVIDVANPAKPTTIGSANVGTGGAANAVYVYGNYAYVADDANHNLIIYNVSNPASPTSIGTVSTGGTNGPWDVAVQGRYAYVTGNNKIQVIDVSNPASPVVAGSSSMSGSGLPYQLSVQGRYVYVTDSNGNKIFVYDISNPASPVELGNVAMGSTANGIAVSGRYAFTANASSTFGFQSFDMGGAYVQQLEVGGLETGTFSANGNAAVNGDASIQGGLNVGGSSQLQGNLSVAGTTTLGSGNLTVNTSGDITAGFTQLDGSSTANGAGANSTSLTLTSAANFDIGNYVQVSSTNCVAGVNVCYAKITNVVGNVLTISPALTWANASAVVEYHVPEVGGSDTAQALANRYGRGYFIDGIVSGNGSTYYTDGLIQTSRSSFQIQTTAGANLFSVDSSGNINATNSIQLNGTSINTAGTLSNVAYLNATGPQTFTGDNKFTGTILSKNASDSTAAFQIQNAASASLFTVDTTNSKIIVNNSGLSIGGTIPAGTAPAVAAGANSGGSLLGSPNTTYYYKVTAITPAGETQPTAEGSINGASFTALSAPGALTATASGTAGNPNGTYTYKVTYITNNGETTGGTTSASVSPVSKQVSLTNIPVGPSGTIGRRIYRTVAGGADGTQKLLTSIYDNTTTSYTDNTADAGLTFTVPGTNTARTDLNNATITFSAVSGATSYRVYRTTTQGKYLNYQTTASSPFTDTGLTGSVGVTPAALQVSSTTNTPILRVDNVNSSVQLGNLGQCANLATDSTATVWCATGAERYVNKLTVFGHSYGIGQGASSTDDRFTTKLAGLLHAQENNQAVAGARLSWHASGNGIGGYETVLQGITNSRSFAPYQANDTSYLFMYGINDLAELGSSNLTPFDSALRTIIARSRAGAIFESETAANITFSGTWVTAGNCFSSCSGTAYKQDATNGDTFTVNVPADFPGGTVDVGFIANSNGTGAVSTFTVDGGAAGSIDTRNAEAPGGHATGLVKRFTGLSAGAHTIVGTTSSVTGTLNVDYWQIESPNPPLTIVPLSPKPANYSAYSVSSFQPNDADIDTLNTHVKSVVSEFDSNVIAPDLTNVLGKKSANFAADGLHPNDQGYAIIASTIYQAITKASVNVDALAQTAAPLNFFSGNNITFKNAADSTTGFQVQNAAGTTVLDIDTTNSRVGIGTTAPAAGVSLDIEGTNTSSNISQLIRNNGAGTGAYSALFLGNNSTQFAGGLFQGSSTYSSYGGNNSVNLINFVAGGSLAFGTANAVQATIASGGATTFKNSTDSTAAFQIQSNTAADTLFTANTSTNKVVIGNSTGTDTATTLLQLDSATADPTSNLVNGSMYYNSSTNKFRCYQNATWQDCIGTNQSNTFQQNGNTFGANANLGTNDNFDLNLRTSGTTRLTVNSGTNANAPGGVGIGTVAGGASTYTLLQVQGSNSSAATSGYLGYLTMNDTATTESVGVYNFALSLESKKTGTVDRNAAGNNSINGGVFNNVYIQGGTSALTYGVSSAVTPNGGNIASAVNYISNGVNGAVTPSGTVSRFAGFQAQDYGYAVSGNQYGLYINQLTSGSSNYAIYTVGSTPSVLSGQLTVGNGTLQPEVLSVVGTNAASASGAGISATDTFKVSAGNGGDTTGLGTSTAGFGADITLNSGAGGSATNALSNSNGGHGGDITLQGGAGGTGQGSGSNGRQGYVLLQATGGNVGIGTATPSEKLDVQGGNINVSGIYKVGGVGGVTSGTCTTGQHLQILKVTGGIVTSSNGCQTGADYAENYVSTQALAAGEVVAVDSLNADQVVRSTVAGQNDLVGVVSTQPGDVIGGPDGYPIALSGRVPVKVNLEGGSILPGDKLTSSSVPGVAKKATGAGMVIGTAMAAYDGSQPDAKVTVFIHISYYDPASGDAIQATSADFHDLNVSGTASIDNLVVQTVSINGDLTVAGLARVQNIEINGHIITASGQPTANPQTAAGTGATVTVDGNDTTGTITINTGSTPDAGAIAQLLFSQSYAKAPHVVISASNDNAAGLHFYKGTTTTADFLFNFKDAPAANTTYVFDYFIAQ